MYALSCQLRRYFSDNPADWQDSVSQEMFPKGIMADLVQELAGAPDGGWDRANQLRGGRTMSRWSHRAKVGSAGWWGMLRPAHLHAPSIWRKGSAPLSTDVCSQAMPWCLKSLQCAPPLGKQDARGFLAKMPEVGFWCYIELFSKSNWICFPSQLHILQCKFMCEHSLRSKNFLSWLN